MAKSEQLKKQNDGMYNNLVKNGLSFERSDPPETDNEDDLIKFYQEEKPQLIKVLREFRKSQAKAPKKTKKAPPQQKKKVVKKPSFSTFSNMEDVKRACFNNQFESFKQLCDEQGYLFYEGEYNYNSDMDGKPDFVAGNLVTGFVRNLDDKKKYFLNCYRCYANEDNTYRYVSYWIVNTDSPLTEVTKGCSDDFTMTKVEKDNLDEFLQKFQASTEDNLVNERYLH